MEFSFRTNEKKPKKTSEKLEKLMSSTDSSNKEGLNTGVGFSKEYLNQIEAIQQTFTCLFQTTIEVLDAFSEKIETTNYDFMMNPFYKNMVGKEEKDLKKIAERVISFILLLEIEESTVIMAFIYIDSLIKEDNHLLNLNSIENILYCSLIIAYKFNEDEIFTDEIMLKVASLTKIKFSNMTNFFLKKIDYKLFVEENDYSHYKNNTNKICANNSKMKTFKFLFKANINTQN